MITSVKMPATWRAISTLTGRLAAITPAVRRNRIAVVGFAMSLGDVGSDGDAAWIGMFDDRDGRLVEVTGGPARRVSIDVVVVRHLLAMQLLSVREATSRAGDAIEGRWLVRVLPVPETGDLLPRPSHPTREAGALTEIADNVAHPARHGYVVEIGRASCRERVL